jgi:hypothetical protein
VSFGTGQRDGPETRTPAADPVSAEPDRQDVQDQAVSTGGTARDRTANMLPGRERRTLGLERLVMRLVATCGIVAIGVALGAILASSDVQGWIIGLVVSVVSVVLSAILWSSRQL